MSVVDQPLCLLAEDEPLLLKIMTAHLEDAGFNVLAAGDGLAAMRLVYASAKPISALVTDIRMPGIDGWHLARRVRELIPGIAVVYVSGDSASRVGVEGVPRSLMLQKPFPGSQLKAAITELLQHDCLECMDAGSAETPLFEVCKLTQHASFPTNIASRARDCNIAA